MTVFPRKDESVTGSPESLISVKSGAGIPSSTIEPSLRRAVGVVRVSRLGDDPVSPSEQAERIRQACERDGLALLATLEETNVSGGTPLERRRGLRQAVEMVEAGQADIVVVAYFDRLVRSLKVQSEVLERVESAGGAVIAVDVGEVRSDTASRWLSSTMLGMVAEYHRRVTAERTSEAKRRAIADGRPTFDRIPPGLRQRDDKRIEPHPTESTIVRDAFELRASGATVREVRDFLRANGIERSYHGVQAMLGSRMYLGELRFGELVNTDSHPAIVDLATWQKVQKMRSPRGRQPKSERLLARLGVLRCATCGARMVTGSTDQNGKRHYMYRCPPGGDCPRRVTISAEIVEKMIWDAVRERTAGIREGASLGGQKAIAQREHELAQESYDGLVELLTGHEGEKVKAKLDAALAEVRRTAAELGRLADAEDWVLTVSTMDDPDELSLEAKRGLILAVVEEAAVAPGRGPDRIAIRLREALSK
jgi:site-specific DNA recombinase